MKAKCIDGSGDEGTAALIEIRGEEYECMDCLAYGRARGYKRGDIIYVRLNAGLLKTDRRGRAVIMENPDHRKALENRGGWRYRAYGMLMYDEPLFSIDCGAVTVECFREFEESMAGDYIAVDIDRLDCWRARGTNP